MPKPTSHQRMRPRGSRPWDTSAVSARIPPSPRLSARMISSTYFSVTMMISAQNSIDSRPWTLSGVADSPCGPENATRSAYSGDVPMSPKTTPMAPRMSGAMFLPAFAAWTIPIVPSPGAPQRPPGRPKGAEHPPRGEANGVSLGVVISAPARRRAVRIGC